MNFNLDGRIFRSVSNSENGEVSGDTIFYYYQVDDIVTGEYSGGEIKRGQILAKMDEDGALDMRYHHINIHGEFKLGKCFSTPEMMESGKLRLREKWQWIGEDSSKGESELEEITA